jgi:hypothetical protein
LNFSSNQNLDFVLGYYNLLPVFAVLFAVCPVLMGLLTFVHDPCPYFDSDGVEQQANGTFYTGFAWLTYYSNVCATGAYERQWFIFRAYVAPILVAAALLWHPVMSGFYRTRLFFDKLKKTMVREPVRVPCETRKHR